MYIEELVYRRNMLKLLEAIKIDPEEDLSNHTAVCLNGVLKVYHHSYALMRHKKRDEVVSAFTDFKVLKIYSSQPSEYDQQLYENIMGSIFKNQNYKAEKRKSDKKKTSSALEDEFDEENESES